MIDRVKVRKAIAAFHKNKERITLAKLARSTGYRYGQLYCEIEFRRFAKKRMKKALPVEVFMPSVPVDLFEDEDFATPHLVAEQTPTVETTQAVAATTTRAMGSATLELQVSEWLHLEMKFPIPAKKRRLVHAWLLAALDFAGEREDDEANDDHGSDTGGAQ